MIRTRSPRGKPRGKPSTISARRRRRAADVPAREKGGSRNDGLEVTVWAPVKPYDRLSERGAIIDLRKRSYRDRPNRESTSRGRENASQRPRR